MSAGRHNLLRFARLYVFNGLSGFLLFGLYVTFVSPTLNRFVDLGETNRFVAFFGFFMLIAEPFALHFKLKNARIRSALKRKAYREATGVDVIPRTGKLIMWGFCARLLLRTATVMVCLAALGYEIEGREADQKAVIILLASVFIDICGLGYIYMTTDFFRDQHFTHQQRAADEKQYQKWNEKNIPAYESMKNYWLEVASDLVLQIYAIMLFTAFIDYTNAMALKQIAIDVADGYDGIDAALDHLPMFIFLFLLGIMPIRIAYWIEDSLLAFTRRERLGQWAMFAVVFLFAFVPFFIAYLLHFGELSASIHWFVGSPLMNVVTSFTFVAAIVAVRVAVFRDHVRFRIPVA